MHTTLKMINKKLNQGFTLIEMSVVILILGVMVAMFSQSYDLYRKHQAIEKTTDNVTLASNIIGDYRALHGRYPCPASMNAPPDTLAYGREDCTFADFGHAFENTLPGECVAGSCIKKSLQDVTYIDPFTGATVTKKARVRIGTLPFRNLNIEEEQTYDGYDNRIFYAVTEHLAFADSYEADTGGIELIGDSGASVLEQSGTAHFMVYSAGANQAGGFTRDGQLTQECPTVGLESRNCDSDLTTAVFGFLEHNETSDLNKRNDDIGSYFTPKALSPWKLSDEEGYEYDTQLRVSVNDVGFNAATNTVLEHELHVGGTVRLSDNPNTTGNEGKLQAEGFCEQGNSANCFKSDLISGTPSILSGWPPGSGNSINRGGGLWCPPGTFMAGIRDGGPVCEDEVEMKCPTGRFMTGIDINGEIICDDPPPANCLSIDVSLCDVSVNIPGGNHNDIFTVEAGHNRKQDYICNNGTWAEEGEPTGQCICTPNEEDIRYDQPCALNSMCGERFSGTLDRQVQYICEPGEDGRWISEIINNRCDCVESTGTVIDECPEGYTGGDIISTSTHLNCAQYDRDDHWANTWCGTPVYESDTCVCEEEDEIRTVDCPDLYGGEYKEERDFTCNGDPIPPSTENTGSWSDWVEVPGDGIVENCACDEDLPLTDMPIDCQAGAPLADPPIAAYGPEFTVGSISVPRYIECVGGVPTERNDWEDVTDTCAEPPPQECTWQTYGGSTAVDFDNIAGNSCACDDGDSICLDGTANYPCRCQ